MARAPAVCALLLVLFGGACNVILGIKDVEEQGGGDIDASISNCQVNESYELLQAADGVPGARISVDPRGPIFFTLALNVDEATDFFVLALWPGLGGLPSPIVPGEYTITAADSKFETCGICALLAVDFQQVFDGDKFYMAHAGTLTIDNVSGRLTATLRGLQFRHVNIGATTTDIGDGCISQIQQVSINMSFPAADAGPPDAMPPPPDAMPPDAMEPPDAMPPPPDAGVTVNGSSIYTYITESNERTVPSDLTSTTVQALVPAGMGWSVYPGSGRADGTFTIPDVPIGKRVIRVGSTYLVTAANQTDFGETLLGRPDFTRVPEQSAYFSVNLGNMEAGKDTDSIEFYILNLNLLFFDGVTLNQTVYDGGGWTSGLIDGGMGDRVIISQLATRMSGVNPYLALSRAITLPSFTTVEDDTVIVPSGSFMTVPQTTTVNINWKRVGFQAERPRVNPQALFDFDELFLSAIPGAPRTDFAVASAPDSFLAHRTDAVDVNFGNVNIGDPFPGGWGRWAGHRSFFHVPYTAPGATTSVDVAAGLSRSEPRAFVNGNPIGILLSPVRTPLINGVDAFMARAGVGTTPLFAWTAPATGMPHGYRVIVNELFKDGTASDWAFVAAVYTTDSATRFPPGLLQAGHTYFARITAYQVPMADFNTRPFRRGLPSAEADLLTATFTP